MLRWSRPSSPQLNTVSDSDPEKNWRAWVFASNVSCLDYLCLILEVVWMASMVSRHCSDDAVLRVQQIAMETLRFSEPTSPLSALYFLSKTPI